MNQTGCASDGKPAAREAAQDNFESETNLAQHKNSRFNHPNLQELITSPSPRDLRNQSGQPSRKEGRKSWQSISFLPKTQSPPATGTTSPACVRPARLLPGRVRGMRKLPHLHPPCPLPAKTPSTHRRSTASNHCLPCDLHYHLPGGKPGPESARTT